ncbi:MAG: hypothetical protein HY084_12005 [Gemmatimonadetes bacterium]|nr:hypothetical protein [Gemmatimonadota bacterium]
MAIAWLGFLAAMVALGLLNGRIRTRGILAQKAGPNRDQASPERVQLLLFTLATSAMYLASTLAWTDTTALPPMDDKWLVAGAGSNGIYVITKVIRRIVNSARAERTSQQEMRS